MNEVYNIYCDESNHLEHSPVDIMVLGAVCCPKNKTPEINKRIKEIKLQYGLSNNFEIKWTKISPAKLDFYRDIIDYFFDDDDLTFRGVVINKKILNHQKFEQSHSDWYYKMYFELLSKMLNPGQKHYIYLDIKDTQGRKKVNKLHEILCNSIYDFEKNLLKKVQQVRSHEINILQLTDLLVGALQFIARDDVTSRAKQNITERIKERSGYILTKSTLPKEIKMNIFYWEGKD